MCTSGEKPYRLRSVHRQRSNNKAHAAKGITRHGCVCQSQENHAIDRSSFFTKK